MENNNPMQKRLRIYVDNIEMVEMREYGDGENKGFTLTLANHATVIVNDFDVQMSQGNLIKFTVKDIHGQERTITATVESPATIEDWVNHSASLLE